MKDARSTLADSPFFALFETDRIPSLQERKMIQELLAEKKAHLAHLNSKVPKRRSGKKVPRQLRAELDQMRRFIKLHQALIAPWRWLPVEILAEIFLFTLEATRERDDDKYWIDDREATLRLCKICSAWRAIAIRTPALWNVLSLFLHSEQGPLDWISTWLDRSRSFPVYLQVFWGVSAPPDNINLVISTFASHIHHTSALWIDGLDIDSSDIIDDTYPTPTFPSLTPSYAPLLYSIGVNLPPNCGFDWIHAACRVSPRLTELTTSQFFLDAFPVTNLTKLQLIDPEPMVTVCQVLELVPALRNISFDVEGPAVTSSAGGVLVSKSIKSMQITSADVLGDFLDQTEFPGLVDLFVHQIVNWPQAQFCSFLTRSSCALTSLDLYDIHMSQDQIIACLQHKACSTLESLAVGECDPPAGSALIQHLTYHEHPWPNPKLKYLELTDIHAPDGLLSTLIASRIFTTPIFLPAGVPVPDYLRKLQFSFVDGTVVSETITHTEDWRRLREMESVLEIDWPDEV
ncbi:hypothetical protein K438DRAFT_1812541 [Mycena galopus ATCC 62051]|nr:hypothetical protein K438DRAFT_1812541 [Mycena galopus ATCC 62051]